MRHHIHTQIEIAAPVERVWSRLVDFSSHSRWNPYLRSIDGQASVGASLRVFVHPPGGRGMYLRPAVLAADPHRELRWKGSLLMPGLLDGEHYFRLEKRPGGGVVFHQGEHFFGVFVPPLRRWLDRTVGQGLVALNEALKRESEHHPLQR